jgi:hypothetical protein
MELGNRAGRPLEAPFCVSEIAHDVAIFPSALLSSRTTQVARCRRTVVNAAQSGNKSVVFSHAFEVYPSMGPVIVIRQRDLQMTDFVCRHDDPRKSTSVFDDCD